MLTLPHSVKYLFEKHAPLRSCKYRKVKRILRNFIAVIQFFFPRKVGYLKPSRTFKTHFLEENKYGWWSIFKVANGNWLNYIFRLKKILSRNFEKYFTEKIYSNQLPFATFKVDHSLHIWPFLCNPYYEGREVQWSESRAQRSISLEYRFIIQILNSYHGGVLTVLYAHNETFQVNAMTHHTLL